MPILNFLNITARGEPEKNQSQDGAYGLSANELAELFSGGAWVSAREALKNSDLFAIINQLSNDLANVTLTADKKRMQGIINNPSNIASRHSFYQSLYAQLLLGGEAFAYRWRNENGTDIKWEFLKPSQVVINPYDYEDGLYYDINFEDPRIGSKLQVPQNDVLHFKLLSVDGGKTGVSPLAALEREQEIQNASHRLTLNALKNSLNANGVLKITGGGLLSMKQKAARSRAVQRQMTGGPLVLDDLEEFTPLEIKSNVADLLGQTQWTTTQFAKVYGIPDSYLGGQGDQQSSLDQIKGMYAHAVSRYVRPVVSELSYKLSTQIDTNIYPAVDPIGESYAMTIADLVKKGVLDQGQSEFLLKRSNFFPDDLPKAKPVNHKILKGGEKDDSD